MGDVSAWGLVVMVVAVFVGSTVQSVAGIGLGLVAAPVVTIAAPALMPASLLLLGLVLPAVTLLGARSDVDWNGLVRAMPGRLVGTALGVWVVATIDHDQLGVAVGCVVLLATILTIRTFTVAITPASLNTAGFLSGVAGTTSAIGGPPMALLYQHRPAAEIRSTMAAFFLVGVSLSLIGLLAGGQLGPDHLALAAVLLPALLAGVAVSRTLRSRLGPRAVRPLVLLLSAASAAVLLVRSLV